jgi:hypothetical protein
MGDSAALTDEEKTSITEELKEVVSCFHSFSGRYQLYSANRMKSCVVHSSGIRLEWMELHRTWFGSIYCAVQMSIK